MTSSKSRISVSLISTAMMRRTHKVKQKKKVKTSKKKITCSGQTNGLRKKKKMFKF
jgi:hypothetical protein